MVKTLMNTKLVEIPSNKQNIVQQFNGRINLESLNNQQEEPIYSIIAHQISNHVNINVGNLY